MCLVLLEQWMNKGNIRRLMSDYALFVEIIFQIDTIIRM